MSLRRIGFDRLMGGPACASGAAQQASVAAMLQGVSSAQGRVHDARKAHGSGLESHDSPSAPRRSLMSRQLASNPPPGSNWIRFKKP